MSATNLPSRAVIRLSALAPEEHPRDFLQGLVTNDLTGPLPCWAALLSPQGKVLFDFLVHDGATDLLVDCEAKRAAALIQRLTLYRLRRKIAIAVDPGVGVHWCLGDGSSPDPRLAALGQRWLGLPADDADDSAEASWLAHRLRSEEHTSELQSR